MTIYVLNAKAEPTLMHHVNKISWTNPSDSSFDHVAVYRRADQFQTDPSSPYGIQVYSGTATTIYDWWISADYVPTDQITYPQIANTDYGQTIVFAKYHSPEKVLVGGQVYYYTIFCYDKNGNWYASPATMVTSAPMDMSVWMDRLWDMLPEIYQRSDGGQMFDPNLAEAMAGMDNQTGRGQLQRLMALFAYAFEWVDAKTKRLPSFLNVTTAEPDKLDYIADLLGWNLDKSLPLTTQRNTLANAVAIYKLAGTRKGLDALVKYHSGFPSSSGVIENSTKTMTALLFSGSQVYFLDNKAPAFDGSMNLSLIGTPSDPLHYAYDFSSKAATGSNKFTAYVQPTYTLTSQQQTDLTTKLKTVLDTFVPAGISYDITIYS